MLFLRNFFLDRITGGGLQYQYSDNDYYKRNAGSCQPFFEHKNSNMNKSTKKCANCV